MPSFIQFALQHQALQLGHFTLKSGRQSPYFFNAGVFSSGQALATLANYYVDVIQAIDCQFDCLFGPAYKGIPLVTATAIALSQATQQPIPFAFNRKTTKDHGEGGLIVGSDIRHKKLLLIDDVITAGTAVHASVELFKSYNATLAGVVVALDRQEQGQHQRSTLAELEQTYGIQVAHITTFTKLIDYLETTHDEQLKAYLPAMRAYQKIVDV